METNTTNDHEIYSSLKREIETFHGTYISLERLLFSAEGTGDDMPAYLQSPEGRSVFYNVVMKLVAEELISPAGKKHKTAFGLHHKYRINNKPAKKDQELAAQIIRSIVPPASLDYYLKNPEDFLHDRVIIEIISGFLRKQEKEIVTLNERAYQLFGDEKFFKGAGKNRSRGEIVLKRLGLSLASLACEETLEPFFSFQKKDFHKMASRNVYIIENKDTFWSFKRNIMDCPSSIKVDMIVYGEGNKIISSFKFIEEYAIDLRADQFFYFGDLDPEGINIYCELLDEYPQYRISPFIEGYQAVLEIGLGREPVKTPKEQKVKLENIDWFSKAFAPSWAHKLKKLLEPGYYIPQEALSAAEMKERFGKSADD